MGLFLFANREVAYRRIRIILLNILWVIGQNELMETAIRLDK